MSPKTKKSLTNISLALGAVLGAWALMGSTVRIVDRHYVLADTFTVYQQGMSRNRAIDSVVHVYELEKLNAMKADVDTIKQMMRRR